MANRYAWKDESSYFRDDKERVPNIYVLALTNFTIKVHRRIYYPADQWFLSTRGDMALSCVQLKSKKIETAQREAVRYVEKMLGRLHKEVLTARFVLNNQEE